MNENEEKTYEPKRQLPSSRVGACHLDPPKCERRKVEPTNGRRKVEPMSDNGLTDASLLIELWQVPGTKQIPVNNHDTTQMGMVCHRYSNSAPVPVPVKHIRLSPWVYPYLCPTLGARLHSTHKSMLDIHGFNRRTMVGWQRSLNHLHDEIVSGDQGLEGHLVIGGKMGKVMGFAEMARHVLRNVCFTTID
jgi:hypothetical protein